MPGMPCRAPPSPSAAPPPPPAPEIEEIIRRGAIRSVYQPIVDLATGEPIGYEALARGPQGTQLESPRALFAAAREAGVVTELEWACRVAAVRGALRAGLPLVARPLRQRRAQPDRRAGPRAVRRAAGGGARPPAPRLRDHRARARRAPGRAAPPRAAAARAGRRDRARRRRRRPALARADALPRARRDQARPAASSRSAPTPAAARIMHAVSAEAERSGAVVVAEGIETPEHVNRARALGAGLGQGWHFGRPGALPESFPPAERPLDRPRAALAALRHAVRDRRRPPARPPRHQGPAARHLARDRDPRRAGGRGGRAARDLPGRPPLHRPQRGPLRRPRRRAPRSSARSATASARPRRRASAAATSPPTTACAPSGTWS